MNCTNGGLSHHCTESLILIPMIFMMRSRSYSSRISCTAQMTAIRHLARLRPEQYRDALRRLFDESEPLAKRVNDFIDTSRVLWDEIKDNFDKNTSALCDERLISCLLTCRYPDKYTLYKNDVYDYVCSITGEHKRGVRDKLVHFYEILDRIIYPAVENADSLIAQVNAEP